MYDVVGKICPNLCEDSAPWFAENHGKISSILLIPHFREVKVALQNALRAYQHLNFDLK